MTDRMKGCWVCFERDIRSDDVQSLVEAIRRLRGVAAVELEVADSSDWMARERVKHAVREMILQLYRDIDTANVDG